jgi:hypothetical protein
VKILRPKKPPRSVAVASEQASRVQEFQQGECTETSPAIQLIISEIAYILGCSALHQRLDGFAIDQFWCGLGCGRVHNSI